MKLYNQLFKKKSVLENWHVPFIVNLASILKPKNYLELGIYQAELFNKLIPHCGRLTGIDIYSDSKNFIKKSNKTNFICSTTDNFFENLNQTKIKYDLIFIDADHSYESVKKDFNNSLEVIANHGIILLHDSYPLNKEFTDPGYCGDGYKAVFELSKKTKNYEMVTIPVHPGLTIARKRTKQVNF